MNTPNTSALMDIGTSALDGRDGDTARSAAQKYNAHYHEATTLADLSAYNTWQARPPKKGEVVVYAGDLYIWTGTESIQIGSGGTELSADVQDALDQAALPSAINPFATMDDIPRGISADPFSADEKDAITGAASPSAANVFATMADIPVSGNALWDWAAGTNTYTEDQLGGTVDAAKWTKSSTLANGGTEVSLTAPASCGGKVLVAMLPYGINGTQFGGALISTVSGNFVYGMRLSLFVRGVNINTAYQGHIHGVFCEDPADLSGNWYGAGMSYGNINYEQGVFGGAGSNDWNTVSSLTSYTWARTRLFDVFITRVSDVVTTYVADPGGLPQQMRSDTGVGTGIGLVGVRLMCASPFQYWGVGIHAFARLSALPGV